MCLVVDLVAQFLEKARVSSYRAFSTTLTSRYVCPSQVELELRAQVRLFKELTGHLPHHMDGHQHVHVLPGNAKSITKTIQNEMKHNQITKKDP